VKVCRPLAGRLAGLARLHGARSAADLALLDAALARREMRSAMAELSSLERKRNLRLRKASEAAARSNASSAEEKQSLDRLARELENEARIFEARITSLSDEIAGLGRRARDLGEKARLLRLRL
jgi:predicted nuclease with TOPRIM domain